MATVQQKAKLTRLIKKGYLTRLSYEAWKSLTKKTAEGLIKLGEERRLFA